LKSKIKRDLYSFLFPENLEAAATTKEILHKLKKRRISDDEFVEDFTKGETDSILYKMKRHECHALLYHLQQAGIIKKNGENWCLDEEFLKILEVMIAQVAELHNLRVKIEYSELDKR